MSKRKGGLHITGWKAIVLVPVAVPIILALKLLGIGQDTERSAEEVAGFIRDFIEGSGGAWDWDDFTSVPIRNPQLEEIRQEASSIDLPPDVGGLDELKKLMARAQALAGETGI